jgi:plastocyanin
MYNSATYSLKFDREGEFDIRCRIHAGMRAKVTVTK